MDVNNNFLHWKSKSRDGIGPKKFHELCINIIFSSLLKKQEKFLMVIIFQYRNLSGWYSSQVNNLIFSFKNKNEFKYSFLNRVKKYG